jgi:hypothetical protein
LCVKYQSYYYYYTKSAHISQPDRKAKQSRLIFFGGEPLVIAASEPQFRRHRLSLRAANPASVRMGSDSASPRSSRNPVYRGIFPGAWGAQNKFANNLRIQMSPARSVSDEAIQRTDSSPREHLQKWFLIFARPTGLSVPMPLLQPSSLRA